MTPKADERLKINPIMRSVRRSGTITYLEVIALLGVFVAAFFAVSSYASGPTRTEAVEDALLARGFDPGDTEVSCSVLGGTCAVVVGDTGYAVSVVHSGDAAGSFYVGFPEGFPRG